MIIAIDGPAGTGKSTVAKGVAQELGFFYFDTGAMYRSFAWYTLQNGIDPSNEKGLEQLLETFDFEIDTDKKTLEKSYFVNGTDISHSIRTQEISKLSSQVAILPFVRQSLVKIQRAFGNKTDAVFEGRDMGTIVFPSAEIKIFLTATPEVRAERRYRDLLLKFPDLAETLSKGKLLHEIEQRDHADSTRKISPLKQASDAILIDTSCLTAKEVISQIVEIVRKGKAGRWEPMNLTYRMTRACALFFFRLFYRLRIYGTSHLRPGSGIFAANHASFYDPPVVSISCPEEVHFLARESLFNVPILGAIIRKLNTHPVSRNASDAHTFRLLIQLLQEGKKIILFPEGKRTLDGSLQPLERGLSFLVTKTCCTIYPVYVEGTFQVWRRGKRFPSLFGHRISCIFGSPIGWGEFEGLDKRQAMEQITSRTEQALYSLKAWSEQGKIGTPP